MLYALSIVAWFCVARRYGPRARRWRRRPRCSHTRATSCSSTSSRATRCSRPRSRSSRSARRARASSRPSPLGGPRLGRRRARARAPGRAGTPAARARAARRRAWRARASGRGVRPSPSRRRPAPRARRRHNAMRADDFAVVRGGSASLLFRTFVADRIVRPENGSASEELARAVSRGLLPNEPYRSRGIDLETFFSSGSSRMHDDLIVLADRTWGWDDDYAHLARVGARGGPRAPRRVRARRVARRLEAPALAAVRAGRGRDRQSPAPRRRARASRRAPLHRRRPGTSRFRPRARRRTSRRPTGASARSGHRRTSTDSSFATRPTARARRRSTARWTRFSTACRIVRQRPTLVRARERPLAPLSAAVHVAPRRHRRRRSGGDRAASPFRPPSPRRRSW